VAPYVFGAMCHAGPAVLVFASYAEVRAWSLARAAIRAVGEKRPAAPFGELSSWITL